MAATVADLTWLIQRVAEVPAAPVALVVPAAVVPVAAVPVAPKAQAADQPMTMTTSSLK